MNLSSVGLLLDLAGVLLLSVATIRWEITKDRGGLTNGTSEFMAFVDRHYGKRAFHFGIIWGQRIGWGLVIAGFLFQLIAAWD